ncbi:MAG: DNA mismatch repair endonuclease MutL [Vibrionaceae bacterium]
MTIQVLPARLANQIAAGEVVERPASVVKELVENCIDAGATNIEVVIEKGGSKLIRVTDNGSGIPKDELALALCRHATSKITCLADLEAIISLGFRGEALASISSVARLTLSSRTAQQEQGWAVHTKGRDMEPVLRPVAHPVGTTVEVCDLFFNTPARKKFLRTEKTEFGHIDQLLKRIALSHLHITLTLTHNGNLVRQYRVATTDAQRERRLAAACGNSFVNNALEISLQTSQLSLRGWICTPQGARLQNDVQYCFVNQRIIKDKLINHAIRQSYANLIDLEQSVAYVLYIDIDPQQVDVNVHPTKHEVRFYQARLVHDFIYQATSDALLQVGACAVPLNDSKNVSDADFSAPPQTIWNELNQAGDSRDASIAKEPFTAERTTESLARHDSDVVFGGFAAWQLREQEELEKREQVEQWPSAFADSFSLAAAPAPSAAQLAPSPQLATCPHGEKEFASDAEHEPLPSRWHDESPLLAIERRLAGVLLGTPLAVMDNRYLLLQKDRQMQLLDVELASQLLLRAQLKNAQQQPISEQPLLLPLRLHLTEPLALLMLSAKPLLQQFGIRIDVRNGQHLQVFAVCLWLKGQDLKAFFYKLADYLANLHAINHENISAWLAQQLVVQRQDFSLHQALSLLDQLTGSWNDEFVTECPRLLRYADDKAVIDVFKNEERIT